MNTIAGTRGYTFVSVWFLFWMLELYFIRQQWIKINWLIYIDRHTISTMIAKWIFKYLFRLFNLAYFVDGVRIKMEIAKADDDEQDAESFFVRTFGAITEQNELL